MVTTHVAPTTATAWTTTGHTVHPSTTLLTQPTTTAATTLTRCTTWPRTTRATVRTTPVTAFTTLTGTTNDACV